jgi:hypothetical protein
MNELCASQIAIPSSHQAKKQSEEADHSYNDCGADYDNRGKHLLVS